ncbi:MAG: IMP dehydrogenase [Clostridia bacterium]|jgi:IMP dehydrogenase
MFTDTKMFIKGYTFDDVLLVPKHSRVKSRSDVNLDILLPRGIKLSMPLVSANMKTVTGIQMAYTIANLGGLSILHRFDHHDVLISNFLEATNQHHADTGAIGASIGIQDDDLWLAKNLYNNCCRIFCVDVAHGDHDRVLEFIVKLKKEFNDIVLIAGNVATLNGAESLWYAGADIIKVGIGSGSLCTTRIETGNGYPQLSALYNIYDGSFAPREEDGVGRYPIFISDGGIRTAGDCVKALVFSDLVMVGNLLAGTDEAPGDIITVSGKMFKQYAGSSTHTQRHIEGVVGLVPYKGSVKNVIVHLLEGIRSGCSYQGVSNLDDLKLNPQFVIISNSGLTESHPHDISL